GDLAPWNAKLQTLREERGRLVRAHEAAVPDLVGRKRPARTQERRQPFHLRTALCAERSGIVVGTVERVGVPHEPELGAGRAPEPAGFPSLHASRTLRAALSSSLNA